MSTRGIHSTDLLGTGTGQKPKSSGKEGDFIVHHLVNKFTAHAVMSHSVFLGCLWKHISPP
jgi:hypothetical protein